MKDLDLTTLRLFVAVCDMRSIARVGERENTVPSAISKRLAQLEQDLGTRLLKRVRRGVEPTAAGVTLCEHSRGLQSYSYRHDHLAIIPLDDAWAHRRFAICFQDERSLSPAAKLLAKHLAAAAINS